MLRTREMKAAQVDRALGRDIPLGFFEVVWLFFAMSPLKTFRWARRLLGGKWVLWWIGSPVNGWIWAPDDGERWPLGTICGREAWP